MNIDREDVVEASAGLFFLFISSFWEICGGQMKTFLHTLTTPEEWSPVSLWAVGIMFALTLAVLAGNAFDANCF